jgi:D-glycero-alpha-D-manno-heptose-7-phosphate kinase
MIITRSPLRISLGGGGTDLPSYYTKYGGSLIAASINKYVYVTVMRPFSPGIYLKYSEIEKVERISQVRHPIIRESLKEFLNELGVSQIEITSLADIPAGTGLGSSGSFTTALLKALSAHFRKDLHPKELAELACLIELEKLKEPIGKQDQYISAFGGITEFTFDLDGSVTGERISLDSGVIENLDDNLLMFYTSQTRSASQILVDQNARSLNQEQAMLDNLHFTKTIGIESGKALKSGNLFDFASLMNEHWEFKRSRTQGMTNPFIDEAYEAGIKNGAIGGKLVGAGGGGFLLFYAQDPENLRNVMAEMGLPELRFTFDFEGTKVILS